MLHRVAVGYCLLSNTEWFFKVPEMSSLGKSWNMNMAYVCPLIITSCMNFLLKADAC